MQLHVTTLVGLDHRDYCGSCMAPDISYTRPTCSACQIDLGFVMHKYVGFDECIHRGYFCMGDLLPEARSSGLGSYLMRSVYRSTGPHPLVEWVCGCCEELNTKPVASFRTGRNLNTTVLKEDPIRVCSHCDASFYSPVENRGRWNRIHALHIQPEHSYSTLLEYHLRRVDRELIVMHMIASLHETDS